MTKSYLSFQVSHSINPSSARMPHGIRQQSPLLVIVPSVQNHRLSSSTRKIPSTLPTISLVVFRNGSRGASVPQRRSPPTTAIQERCSLVLQKIYTSTMGTQTMTLMCGERIRTVASLHCPSATTVTVCSWPIIRCTVRSNTLIESSNDLSIVATLW